MNRLSRSRCGGVRSRLVLTLRAGVAAVLCTSVGASVAYAAPATSLADSATTAADLGDSLIAHHQCWRGDNAPAAHIPTHVVVSKNGSNPIHAGPTITGLALEQIFNNTHHDLIVYAFCP